MVLLTLNTESASILDNNTSNNLLINVKKDGVYVLLYYQSQFTQRAWKKDMASRERSLGRASDSLQILLHQI